MRGAAVQHGGPKHGDPKHGGAEHGHTKVSHLAWAIVDCGVATAALGCSDRWVGRKPGSGWMIEAAMQHGGPKHDDTQHGDAEHGCTKVSHLAWAIVDWSCDCCFGMLG